MKARELTKIRVNRKIAKIIKGAMYWRKKGMFVIGNSVKDSDGKTASNLTQVIPDLHLISRSLRTYAL
jgi:hypothetical protein